MERIESGRSVITAFVALEASAFKRPRGQKGQTGKMENSAINYQMAPPIPMHACMHLNIELY